MSADVKKIKMDKLLDINKIMYKKMIDRIVDNYIKRDRINEKNILFVLTKESGRENCITQRKNLQMR